MALSFTDLRQYQTMALEFIGTRRRLNLFAGMGVGKTVSVLTALDTFYLCGYETRPTLVLAPHRVASTTWPNEPAKWEHLRHLEISPIIGNAVERLAAIKRDAQIYTANYEILPWLCEHYGDKWPFGIVVADESTKLKSYRGSLQVSTRGKEFVRSTGSIRARALGKLAHTKITRWINASGTPTPNGLIDLWGQCWFVDQGTRLGRTYESFEKRWFRPSPNGFGIEPFEHSQAEIQDKIRDITLSIEAKDWFDLKEPVHNKVYVELPSRARKLYQEMKKNFFIEIDGEQIEAFNAASKSMKLLQLANGAIYTDPTTIGEHDPKSRTWKEVHDGKIDALKSIVSEAAGMPVLVAYHFKSDLARLRAAFPKGRVLDKDPQTQADWNAGLIPIMFAHPASAGHGLNLQDGGCILAFFSLNWNLEEHEQIIERIGPTRQAQSGHNRVVFLHYILARGTIDELVFERLRLKRTVGQVFMDAMKRTDW